jgi:hypothetical protein
LQVICSAVDFFPSIKTDSYAVKIDYIYCTVLIKLTISEYKKPIRFHFNQSFSQRPINCKIRGRDGDSRFWKILNMRLEKGD